MFAFLGWLAGQIVGAAISVVGRVVAYGTYYGVRGAAYVVELPFRGIRAGINYFFPDAQGLGLFNIGTGGPINNQIIIEPLRNHMYLGKTRLATSISGGIRRARQKYLDEMKRQLQFGYDGIRQLRRYTPSVTGELLRSIEITRTPATTAVVYTAEYAAAVRYRFSNGGARNVQESLKRYRDSYSFKKIVDESLAKAEALIVDQFDITALAPVTGAGMGGSLAYWQRSPVMEYLGSRGAGGGAP